MFSFSAKEAIYKAIDPFVRRYVGFQEVELSSPTGPDVSARLDLPEGPFESEVFFREFGAFVVTFAKVRRKT
jgi:4'-phosphopantetheinyl transferase EntD